MKKKEIMESSDPVLSRRSIRRFSDSPVSPEKIEMVLKAAMAAPSADDERPWHFIVINERNILDGILRSLSSARVMQPLPLAILVCGDLTKQKMKDFWVQDCAAATENILIEAQIQGLGSVWLGIYPIAGRIETTRKHFTLPETIMPFSLVALGYPDEKKGPSRRYDSRRVHYNAWTR